MTLTLMMIRTNVKAQKKRNVRKRILTILIPMMIRKNVKAIKIRIVEKKILIILILMKKTMILILMKMTECHTRKEIQM